LAGLFFKYKLNSKYAATPGVAIATVIIYKCKKTYQFKTQCKDDMVISDI